MSAPRQDILLDSNGDFPLEDIIQGGVYIPTPYGVSDTQHCIDLVFDCLGATKEIPNIAFNASQYLKAETIQGLYSILKKVLEFDGYSSSPNLIRPQTGVGFVIDFRYIYPNY